MSERIVGEGLNLDLQPRIAKLILGVAATAATIESGPIPYLEGADNGLYARLCQLATSLGEIVADDDARTGEILNDGRRGLRRQMYAGMTNFVKQGSPLEMTATLAHEQGHRYTADVFDLEGCVDSETIADGSAFVVCDYFGLDISPRSFPFIAGYNSGQFSADILDGIQSASTDIIQGLTQQA
ncbi:MAG: hypothetical protein ACYCPS_03940 [Candidatus Saccharimonadales bacterium]